MALRYGILDKFRFTIAEEDGTAHFAVGVPCLQLDGGLPGLQPGWTPRWWRVTGRGHKQNAREPAGGIF
ncbi:MAG: hypothetical protein ACLR8P_16705 [Clostridium fessum]